MKDEKEAHVSEIQLKKLAKYFKANLFCRILGVSDSFPDPSSVRRVKTGRNYVERPEISKSDKGSLGKTQGDKARGKDR